MIQTIQNKIKALSIIFLCLAHQFSFAQKTEFKVSVNSGLYSFIGNGAESESFLNASSNSARVNNPYGSKSLLSIGGSGNLKHIAKNNFLFGGDLGIETVRSKSIITAVNVSGSNSPATGTSVLTQNFINLYPFAGYRLNAALLSIDFMLGADLAYAISAKQKVQANINGGASFANSYDNKIKDFDFRPRAQVGVNYQSITLCLGYAIGLVDYNKGALVLGSNTVNSSYLRFGIGYKLK